MDRTMDEFTIMLGLRRSTEDPADVAEYSGILLDLAGFETARDSMSAIAEKITGAVVLPDAA